MKRIDEEVTGGVVVELTASTIRAFGQKDKYVRVRPAHDVHIRTRHEGNRLNGQLGDRAEISTI